MAISIDTLTQKGELSWGPNPKNWWQGNWWLLKGRISLLLRMKLITCLIENGQPWNHVHRQEKWLGRLYLYMCPWMCKYVNVCIVCVRTYVYMCVCTHMCMCVCVCGWWGKEAINVRVWGYGGSWEQEHGSDWREEREEGKQYNYTVS